MEEQKEYQNYSFKNQEELDGVTAGFIASVREDADNILNKRLDVGIIRLWKLRYDMIHKETGEVATKTIKQEDLVNYNRVYNHERTRTSSPEEWATEAGLTALDRNNFIGQLHVLNVDNGKGQLITEQTAASNEEE